MSADLEAIERDRELAKKAFEEGFVAGRSQRTVAEAIKDYLDREHPLPGPRPYEGVMRAILVSIYGSENFGSFGSRAHEEWRAAVQAALEQAIPEGAEMYDRSINPPTLYHDLRRYLATWQPPAGDARD